MKRRKLASELARATGITRAEAADEVDRMVNNILQRLRSGESAKLPGFGQLLCGPDGKIEFQKEPESEKL
jgi:nucleoid DNA-binding protein